MRPAAAIVLSGGRSARFGSDKALAPFRGSPLLAHVLRAARGGFREVLLVAKDPERYRPLLPDPGVSAVADLSSLYTPLSGLEAGLGAAQAEVAFCCAADMPFAADGALLDALFEALAGHDAAAPIFGGVLQPLCALYRRAPCHAAARELLSHGPLGPRRLLERVRTAQVPWSDPRPFLDADTPEQLAAMEGA